MAEVAKCPKCGKPIDETHEHSWCIKCGEPLPEEIKNRLPKVVALRNDAAAVAPQPTPSQSESGGVPAARVGPQFRSMSELSPRKRSTGATIFWGGYVAVWLLYKFIQISILDGYALARAMDVTRPSIPGMFFPLAIVMLIINLRRKA